jgi:hypothetical protein
MAKSGVAYEFCSIQVARANSLLSVITQFCTWTLRKEEVYVLGTNIYSLFSFLKERQPDSVCVCTLTKMFQADGRFYKIWHACYSNMTKQLGIYNLIQSVLDISLLHSVQTDLGPTHLAIQWVPRSISPGVKRQGHKTPSTAEVKKGGAIPPLPHIS